MIIRAQGTVFLAHPRFDLTCGGKHLVAISGAFVLFRLLFASNVWLCSWYGVVFLVTLRGYNRSIQVCGASSHLFSAPRRSARGRHLIGFLLSSQRLLLAMLAPHHRQIK